MASGLSSRMAATPRAARGRASTAPGACLGGGRGAGGGVGVGDWAWPEAAVAAAVGGGGGSGKGLLCPQNSAGGSLHGCRWAAGASCRPRCWTSAHSCPAAAAGATGGGADGAPGCCCGRWDSAVCRCCMSGPRLDAQTIFPFPPPLCLFLQPLTVAPGSNDLSVGLLWG